MLHTRARLLISCPDRPGIVAAVSHCLFEQGANIVHSDQHTTDPEGGVFFMRIEFDLPELNRRIAELERAFEPVARRFRMDWRLANAARVKPLAIFVSKEDHCLLELLWRWRAHDIAADIAMVVSNHPNLREPVEAYGIPFHHIAVTREKQHQAEAAQLQLVEGKVDLIIMARYMRILSPSFIRRFPNRIINIHHSFLPAFVGADPYAQALSRGVKLIGATAHYATDALDGGPIIEQDVERVDHRHNVEDLKRIGRHVERMVLARAVTWHLEDKVLVHGNKTVVFA
ncbi:MAG: formyltetrahydrofolate deformylase [candidate division NC10 bacterium]|nr:formyltetrahydrofolate deformylase [candidate division NC10 bacterium]MDE2321895.1 formyltetrahydrofolate deformylase [candidate division NC10 bacterium]